MQRNIETARQEARRTSLLAAAVAPPAVAAASFGCDCMFASSRCEAQSKNADNISPMSGLQPRKRVQATDRSATRRLNSTQLFSIVDQCAPRTNTHARALHRTAPADARAS